MISIETCCFRHSLNSLCPSLARRARHYARSLEHAGPRCDVLLLLFGFVWQSELVEEIFDQITVGAVRPHGNPFRATGFVRDGMRLSSHLALGWLPAGCVHSRDVFGFLRQGIRYEESRKCQEEIVG